MTIVLDRQLDFVLPKDLEATEPPEARGIARDHVRLLVSHIGDGSIVHARFVDLPEILHPGDLLVANDSATLPAALVARRSDGTEIAFHLSTALVGSLWVVEPRKTAVYRSETLSLPGSGRATLLDPYAGSTRLWIAQLDLPEPIVSYLHRWGRPIAYDYVRGRWPIAAYQTIYAREPGSAEMPSAGRAFTAELLRRLAERSIAFATITLHTGVSSLEAPEPPYPERYVVPSAAADAVELARARGGRIIAVGTTAVRALETAADQSGRVIPSRGWTDLVVTPSRGVRVVDGLLTGFHEPKASHLAMLAAIAGRAHLEKAYHAAVDGGYLWHEFGDLHLLVP